MTEFKVREHGITKRLSIKDDGKTLEVHSTMLGYPIRFPINDELREFLRSL